MNNRLFFGLLLITILCASSVNASLVEWAKGNWTVTADTYASNNYPNKTNDRLYWNGASNIWQPASGTNHWARFNASDNTAKKIEKYTILEYNGGGYTIYNWSVFCSNDSTTWTVIDIGNNSLPATTNATANITRNVTTTGSCKVVQINFTNSQAVTTVEEVFFYYDDTPSGEIPVINATLSNAVNGSSWPSSVTFRNITGSLTFNYFNITSSGYCVSYSGNGTGTNCTAGNGASEFFNVTNTSSVNSTQTITAATYSAILRVNASQLYTGNAISTFNVTNWLFTNQTTDGQVTVSANAGSNNIKVDVHGNFSKNITCTASSLQSSQCNVTGVYDNQYSFAANNSWAGTALNNFTISVTNNSLGGMIYNASTTNGSLNVSLLQGYNYFVQFTNPNGAYEYKNVSLSANASSHLYRFQVLPTPSVNITIKDANTGSIITQNITIVLTSNTTGEIVYTSSGGYFVTDLEPELYSIRVYNVNYSSNTYTVTAIEGGVYYLTAYLQQNASDVIMQFVDSISSSVVLSGVAVTQYRLVSGSWEAISSRQTDVTGRAVFGYLPDVQYRFIAVMNGYAVKQFDLDPILFSTYTVKMTRSTTVDFDEDFQSVYLNYRPNIFVNGQQNTINITFASPLGTFSSYSYNVRYPGGPSKNGSGSNALGETFSIPFNISGANYTSTVNVTLTYDTSNSDARQFSYTSGILVGPGNSTFISNRNNTYGMGLIERALVGTIIIVIAAGLISLAATPIAGAVIALFMMGLFIYMGFWEWWLAGISFLVGFVIIAARSN